MSAQPAHLRPVEDKPDFLVVNPLTGEPAGKLEEHLQPLLDQIAGLQRDIQGWTMRFAELKREKEAEAENSQVWPAALRVFDYWRTQTGRTKRTVFTLDRFEMVRPWLEKLGDPKCKAEERLAEAEALCKLAIDGIVFDHFVEQAKNGTERHHTGWHLIFKEADLFEKRCNSAPLERIREVIGERTVKEAITRKRESRQQSLDQAQQTR